MCTCQGLLAPSLSILARAAPAASDPEKSHLAIKEERVGTIKKVLCNA